MVPAVPVMVWMGIGPRYRTVLYGLSWYRDREWPRPFPASKAWSLDNPVIAWICGSGLRSRARRYAHRMQEAPPWQTYRTQNPVPVMGVWVQVPPSVLSARRESAGRSLRLGRPYHAPCECDLELLNRIVVKHHTRQFGGRMEPSTRSSGRLPAPCGPGFDFADLAET